MKAQIKTGLESYGFCNDVPTNRAYTQKIVYRIVQISLNVVIMRSEIVAYLVGRD